MSETTPSHSVGVVSPQIAKCDTPFTFTNGAVLSGHQLVYETYGELNSAGDNAVLICHALSGSHHAAGFHSEDDHRPGWWDLAIGPGKPIDTERLFVVCSNNLGCCDGSSGPNTQNPDTGAPWGGGFPQPQVKDWVRSQKWLAEYLGISRWAAVIGGSLGGMQALQWAIDFPDFGLKTALRWRRRRVSPHKILPLTKLRATQSFPIRTGVKAITWQRAHYRHEVLHWREWSATSPICPQTV